MLHRRQQSHTGYTLIEIMVTMGIISILAAIAIPAYNGYVRTARMAEGKESITLLHLAQVEFFEENGFFFIGTGTTAVITASSTLWRPVPWDQTLTTAANIALLNFTYDVANCALGGGGNGAVDGTGNPTQCYTITATGQNMLNNTEILTESN